MPVIVVEDDALHLAFGSALASSQTITNVGPRVLVTTDIDVSWGSPWASGPLCAGDAGTLTATFNDTLGRVELAGTGWDPTTMVLIERSTNQFTWTPVRGATELAVSGGAFAINDYEYTDGVVNYYRVTSLAPIGCVTTSTSVTPEGTCIWIKSVVRPFLNICIPSACAAMGENDIEWLVSQGAVNRRARNGLFPIVNRTYEIAVTDLRLGRDWSVLLRTFTATALQQVDFLLAGGDVLFIQLPAGCIKTTGEEGYVAAFDAGYTRHHRYRNRAVWEIPVVEVAAPGPDIAYAENTWQTVINRYGTWADVLAAHATWASLLTELPDPSEVIVP